MNLLEKANTITTPTAYSNGFLHSVKPEVVENLLLQSNQFDTTWTTFNASVTSGQSGYDGTNNAWLLTATNTFNRAQQSISVSGVKRFSVYAKANTNDYLLLGSVEAAHYYATFNLATGAVDSNNVNVILPSIESVGGGWYRCSATWLNTTTEVRIASQDASGQGAWSSTTSGSIYIQDAQLNKGLTAYPYLETTTEAKPSADFTFTRNSSATRVNELGYIEDVQIIGGELVSNGDFEEIGSELIVDGGWVDSDGAAEFYDNKIKINSGINGTLNRIAQSNILENNKTYRLTYEVLEDTGVSNFSYFNGSVYVDAPKTIGVHTIYYTKQGTSLTLYLRVGDSVAGNYIVLRDNVSVKEVGQDWTFNNTEFSLGQVDFDASSDWCFQTISFTTGNKYRFTFNGSGYLRYRTGFAGTDGTIQTIPSLPYSVDIIATSDTNRIQVFGSNSGSGTLTSASVKEVTDDTNLPRINYEGFTYENGLPVPHSGKGHLLLEGQRTNLVTYSENFSAWTPSALTITDNDATSPEGVSNAAKLTLPSGVAVKRIALGSMPTSAVSRSYSFFIKSNDITAIQLVHSGDLQGYARFDISNGVIGSMGSKTTSSIEDYGNGWYRCIANFDSTNTFGPTIYLYINDDASGGYGGSTAAQGNLFIYGAQYEEGSYPTSYIPTNGTAVTRLGETCNNATHSFPSEGVLYAEIAALANDGTLRELTISDGTPNNRVIISYDTFDRIRLKYRNAGVNVFDEAYEAEIKNFNKIAIRYKENEFSFWLNGFKIFLDTNGSIVSPGTFSELSFDSGDNSFPMYSRSKMVATFPYLSDSEMACLTNNPSSPFGPFYPFEQRVLADGATIEGFTCMIDDILAFPQSDAGRQLFDAYDTRVEAASGDTEARVCTINELNDLL